MGGYLGGLKCECREPGTGRITGRDASTAPEFRSAPLRLRSEDRERGREKSEFPRMMLRPPDEASEANTFRCGPRTQIALQVLEPPV